MFAQFKNALSVRNSILVLTALAIGGLVGFYFSPHPMAQSLVLLALQKISFKLLVAISFYWTARFIWQARRHQILAIIPADRPDLKVKLYCTGMLCIALIFALAR